MNIPGFYNLARTVTKSDTVDIDIPAGLEHGPSALYIGTKGSTGTAVVLLEDGTVATFVGLQAGSILPVRVTRLKSTTTDVSDVVALWQV